jgi:hypothetical protein
MPLKHSASKHHMDAAKSIMKPPNTIMLRQRIMKQATMTKLRNMQAKHGNMVTPL